MCILKQNSISEIDGIIDILNNVIEKIEDINNTQDIEIVLKNNI